MTVEEAIRARLLALPLVTAEVDSRVYTLTFPQNPTWPAIRVQEISEQEDFHLRGSIGLRRGRVQVDVVATTFSVAAGIMADVHGSCAGAGASGLSGFVGAIAGDPPFVIAALLADGARSIYDPDELSVVRLSRDYAVAWRER